MIERCKGAEAGSLCYCVVVQVRSDMVVVYVLRPSEDGREHELLQMRRRESDYMGGTWQFCSGKIEPGETGKQAALRELREETGLRPRVISHLSYVETFYMAAADTIWHRAGFCAVIDRSDTVRLNAEHTAFRWIRRWQVRQAVMWPGERAALAEIFREHLRSCPASPHRRLDLE